jgi:hypothetical protein
VVGLDFEFLGNLICQFTLKIQPSLPNLPSEVLPLKYFGGNLFFFFLTGFFLQVSSESADRKIALKLNCQPVLECAPKAQDFDVLDPLMGPKLEPKGGLSAGALEGRVGRKNLQKYSQIAI